MKNLPSLLSVLLGVSLCLTGCNLFDKVAPPNIPVMGVNSSAGGSANPPVMPEEMTGFEITIATNAGLTILLGPGVTPNTLRTDTIELTTNITFDASTDILDGPLAIPNQIFYMWLSKTNSDLYPSLTTNYARPTALLNAQRVGACRLGDYTTDAIDPWVIQTDGPIMEVAQDSLDGSGWLALGLGSAVDPGADIDFTTMVPISPNTSNSTLINVAFEWDQNADADYFLVGATDRITPMAIGSGIYSKFIRGKSNGNDQGGANGEFVISLFGLLRYITTASDELTVKLLTFKWKRPVYE